MLRRSSIRLHSLFSTHRHGIFPISRSPFSEITLVERRYPFCSPASLISPIQFNLSHSLRQYSTRRVKKMTEIEMEEKLQELMEKAKRGEDVSDYDTEDEDGDDYEDFRYEDYEPELKIFEDPFMDREPPPEPDEETKKDVAELVDLLRQMVEKMPPRKPRKKPKDPKKRIAGDQKGGGGGTSLKQKPNKE